MSTPAPTPFYTSAGVESLMKTDKPTAAEVLLDKLQGTAADPERIGAEYLPEVIEGVYELADATGAVVDEGQIARVNDHPVFGDGLLEGKVMGPRIVRASGALSNIDLQSEVLLKVASIPISGARLLNESDLFFDIFSVLDFSALDFPQEVRMRIAFSDFTGDTGFASASEMNHVSCLFSFGPAPVATTVFQVSGAIGVRIQFVPADGVFVTVDNYRIRELTSIYSGATLTKGIVGESQVVGVQNYGTASVNNNSKCPKINENCMVSFYLSIPASSGETRSLKYNMSVRAWF